MADRIIMNPAYKADANISHIKSIYNLDAWIRSVSLQQFLEKESYGRLRNSIAKLSYKKFARPMHFSCSKAACPKSLADFLNSGEFLGLARCITGAKIRRIKAEGFCFGWKDYMILHDEAVEKEGIDIIFDFADSWDAKAGSGIVYTDGKGDSAKIAPSGNTLILAERKKGVQRFVQYANHLSGNRKHCFVLGKAK
ncbi:hypothetical protein HYX09_06115 [Candidatus Woesearchaeota archaeon]|nr:hypothetical protein [Candidatus Woesearchaeota archaeon]